MQFKLFKNKEKAKNLNLNLNEKTREKSTGRSMVEMLGVLAIIGVLSIGGISGYTIAMRKYRANEIANLLTKYVNITYMNFYNYMMNNPDKVQILDDGNGHDYICQGDTDDWDRSNCPFYSDTFHKNFENTGLGELPNGVTAIETNHLYESVNNLDKDQVQFIIRFEDKNLCNSVANVFAAYKSSDGSDGNNCQEYGMFDKLIPMD